MNHEPSDAPSTGHSRRQAMVRVGIFLGIIGAALFIAWRLGVLELSDRERLLAAIARVRELPYLIPAFILAYAAAITFGLPASAFTLAGGALFGFWQGSLYNWMGATAGAVLAYLFANTLCRGTCREILGRRAADLERLATEHGFVGTLRLRLIPVVPFSLLNFAAALAGVGRRDYILATAIGIIPGTAVYTWFADSLLQGAEGASRNALVRVAIAGGLLVLLSFIPNLIRRIRGA